jgi:divalent metal cation (Fe/Co/Zn/Cd) transporter
MEQSQKQKAASLSVIATSTLTAIKLLVGWWSGSVSVFSEGLHSGTDLLAALMAWFAIRQSGKPPDLGHPYGHGKFESLSGAVEAILIWVACLLIVWESIQRLIHGVEVSQPIVAIAVMTLSTVVNFIVSAHLFAVARKTESLALEADGWHLRTDAYSSGAVLIVIAAFIAKAGFDLLRQATHHLLDASLPPTEESVITRVLQNHSQSFINAHQIRTRQAGKHRYIDLHLVVRDDMTVEEAHQLCDEIEREIKRELPDADVTIHVEPESAFKLHDSDEVARYRFIRRPPKSK